MFQFVKATFQFVKATLLNGRVKCLEPLSLLLLGDRAEAHVEGSLLCAICEYECGNQESQTSAGTTFCAVKAFAS